MEWRHGTWQCACCRFKLGCCEGDPQTNCNVSGEGQLEHGADLAANAGGAQLTGR
jgi:hypothetical protein